LTDSDAATWELISAGGNLKAAKDGSDYLSIDSGGNVNVNGGGYVKIGPADTQAELRLYRDDSTINTAGIAIGDINFGGADANNDNAARLRVKSDGAWTASSSPTAFEFQTCPSGSESPQTRLIIASDGQVGIGVAPAAKLDVHDNANNQRLIRISHPTSPTEAGGYLGFASDGTTDNNLVVLGVQYSGSYYDALTIQRSTRLATFSGGITVSGGVTSLGSFTNLDISSGAITITSSTHKVDTEGGAATDDLDTINGGTDGSILVIQSNNNDRDVSAKDGTGNLQLAGNYELNHSSRKLTLIKSGSVWYELSRSSNI